MADPKPNFRRGGRANDAPTEWIHLECSRGGHPVIEAQYAGTCAECLGRIEEGDEIVPFE